MTLLVVGLIVLCGAAGVVGLAICRGRRLVASWFAAMDWLVVRAKMLNLLDRESIRRFILNVEAAHRLCQEGKEAEPNFSLKQAAHALTMLSEEERLRLGCSNTVVAAIADCQNMGATRDDLANVGSAFYERAMNQVVRRLPTEVAGFDAVMLGVDGPEEREQIFAELLAERLKQMMLEHLANCINPSAVNDERIPFVFSLDSVLYDNPGGGRCLIYCDHLVSFNKRTQSKAFADLQAQGYAITGGADGRGAFIEIRAPASQK